MISVKDPSFFLHVMPPILFNKYGAKPFVRLTARGTVRHQAGTCRHTIDYRQARNYKLQIGGRHMERNEKFKTGLVLGQINRKGNALFSFLNVTLVHFGASGSIFNVLNQCRKIFNLINSLQASDFCLCETSQRL